MRNLLTVIIPTHNREAYLDRSMSYWRQFDIRVIVADSSANQSDIEFNNNIEYLYCSGWSFSNKVHTAIQMVDTPYVVMCPDDDFQTESGLRECIDFLQDNREYSAAQGRYINFIRNKDEIFIKEIYQNKNDFNVNSCDVLERVREGILNYNNWLWSVHRSNSFKATFAAYKNVINGNLIEIGVAIGHLSEGGHIQLPVFFQAREELPISWGRTEENFSFDGQSNDDLSNWRVNTSALIGQLATTDADYAAELLAAAEAAYCEFVNSCNGRKNTISTILEKYFPAFVYSALIKVKRKVYISGPHKKGYQSQKDYHWSDPVDSDGWQRIMATLEQEL